MVYLIGIYTFSRFFGALSLQRIILASGVGNPVGPRHSLDDISQGFTSTKYELAMKQTLPKF